MPHISFYNRFQAGKQGLEIVRQNEKLVCFPPKGWGLGLGRGL